MAVIPSFWLYFAEQKLGWGGLSGTSDWHPLARDFVAAEPRRSAPSSRWS